MRRPSKTKKQRDFDRTQRALMQLRRKAVRWSLDVKVGNYGIEGQVAESIRDWLKRQNDVTSWTYMGGCPSFINNGSSPLRMSVSERRALHKLSRGIT